MIARPLEADIISAPLAAIDRRALSQAWYSALHLARAVPNAPETRAVPEPAAPSVPAKPNAPRVSSAPSRANLRLVRSVRIGAVPHADGLERRAPSSTLARAIEAALRAPRRPGSRSTLCIDTPQGRVMLLLARGVSGGSLIAICPKRLRARVERALAQVRYALAARGEALQARTSEVYPCS